MRGLIKERGDRFGGGAGNNGSQKGQDFGGLASPILTLLSRLILYHLYFKVENASQVVKALFV